jgi:hypothetical protein
MKEFSNKIMLCPIDQLPVNLEPPFVGFDTLFSNIDIKPDLKESNTANGPRIDFKLRAVFSDDKKSIIEKYKNFRPFKLILFDTDGYYYLFEDQIKASIDPISFTYEFNMSRSMLKHPF